MAEVAMKSYDHLFKILLIGDAGTDKTALLFRFAEEAFNPTFVSTVGIDFKVRTIDLDGKRVKLQMWDTAGQERFRSITTAYFRGAMGIMLVYDITNQKTFDNMETGWIPLIKTYAHEGTVVMLVGNKCEQDDRRQVPTSKGEKLAAEHGMKFIETSPKANITVDEAFYTLARDIYSKRAQTVETFSINTKSGAAQKNIKAHHKEESKTWFSIKETVRMAFGFSSSSEQVAQPSLKTDKRTKDRNKNRHIPGDQRGSSIWDNSVKGSVPSCGVQKTPGSSLVSEDGDSISSTMMTPLPSVSRSPQATERTLPSAMPATPTTSTTLSPTAASTPTTTAITSPSLPATLTTTSLPAPATSQPTTATTSLSTTTTAPPPSQATSPSPTTIAPPPFHTSTSLSPANIAPLPFQTSTSLSPATIAPLPFQTSTSLSPATIAPLPFQTSTSLSPATIAPLPFRTSTSLSPATIAPLPFQISTSLSRATIAPLPFQTSTSLLPATIAPLPFQTSTSLSPATIAPLPFQTSPSLSPATIAPLPFQTSTSLSPATIAPLPFQTTTSLSTATTAPLPFQTSTSLSTATTAPSLSQTSMSLSTVTTTPTSTMATVTTLPSSPTTTLLPTPTTPSSPLSAAEFAHRCESLTSPIHQLVKNELGLSTSDGHSECPAELSSQVLTVQETGNLTVNVNFFYTVKKTKKIVNYKKNTKHVTCRELRVRRANWMAVGSKIKNIHRPRPLKNIKKDSDDDDDDDNENKDEYEKISTDKDTSSSSDSYSGEEDVEQEERDSVEENKNVAEEILNTV